MERVFLNWDRPFLPQAADWLLRRYTDGAIADMRRVYGVVPGARAGRLLLGMLARECDRAGIELIPPRVVTPGALAPALLHVDTPLATREERTFAWLEALRSATPLEIATLLPETPAADDTASWQDLARTLETLNDEIAAGGLAFSEVPLRAECLELFAEGDRWRALERVAERYRETLAACGLAEPHVAYGDALAKGLHDERVEVVLLAVTELSSLATGIAERLGVAALVHAPETLSDRFDDLGRPDPDAWATAPIPVRDEHIAVADGPSDQAQAVLRAIAALGGARAPEAITIGVGEPELVEPITRAAKWAGLDVHDAAGTPLARSAPWRLLEAVATRLEDPGFRALAALLRHPDVERWQGTRLGFEGDTAGAHFTVLDRYFTDHLDPGLLAGRDDLRVDGPLLDAIRKGADRLLRPLAGAAGKRPQPLAEWCDPILGILRTVYGELDREPDDAAERAKVAACLKIRDVLTRHANADARLQVPMDGAAALRYLLAAAAGETLAADARSDQVEMLGWLELHLDPAPVLVLAGCVEGRVPEAVHGGMFLPDVLRRVLDLPDNRHRYARDAYLLEAITHCRETLTIVVGRRDAQGEPLAPSRLLLACDDDAMVRRVRELCADGDGTKKRAILPPVGAPACGARSRFTIPELPPVGAPEHMAVTDFRWYLECPYRYALARRLRLRVLADDANELDGAAFGNLAHAVLQRFGDDTAIRDSDDADAIAAWLDGALATEVERRYGPQPLPAVRIQVARLEQRLAAFARTQADLRRDGWVIEAAEHVLGEDARLEMKDSPDMPLSGIIDRIDRHESTGCVRIIDYKTGDTVQTPFQKHHGGKRLPRKSADIEWIDLQLPLYDYLARQAGLGDEIEVGYLVLPRKTNEVDFLGALWEAEHLALGVDRARAVVTDIRNGVFALNRQYDKRYDDFARICQSLTFHDDEDEDEESAS